jgi:DNA repair protein RadD
MVRIAGFSGTVFRLQGGSLVDGEEAPFSAVSYRYTIVDGIRDGYLVPAFSVTVDDKIDSTKLKTRQGDFTGESQDAQMLGLIDNHIAQMLVLGRDRRAWLVFEASTKAAKAMTARLNEWGVATGLVLGETPAGQRAATIAAYRAGRLRCLVNVSALTTGFDVQEVDMLVMRRATKSLGLYIQMTGRLLRTIGGSIETSIAAGKADAIVLDFANLISTHGPLDFIRPKDTAARLVSCEVCSKRNAAAAARCWSCDEPMTKLCPACLACVAKGVMDCPGCGYDMRAGERGPAAVAKLLETPSGAALISSYKTGSARDGGWLPIRKAWERDGTCEVVTDKGEVFSVPASLSSHAADARWIRQDGALLVPNGASRTSVLQITADGTVLPVPMPGLSGAV